MRNRFFTGCISVSLFICVPFLNAQQSSAPQTGYVRLIPSKGTSAPAGTAIVGLRSGGVLITEAGIQSSTMLQSGRLFVESGGPLNTGIALANSGNQDVLISYYFTDSTGRDFGAGSFTLSANHQMSGVLTDSPFSLTSPLTGTFTFSSSGPISAAGWRILINQRNEQVLTGLPLSNPGVPLAGTTLLFPRFVAGAGWTPQVVLINPEDRVLSGTLQFFGPGSKTGNTLPTQVVVNGVTGSVLNYTVPPRSAFSIVAQPSKIDASIGSVLIAPSVGTGLPSSLAILSYEKNQITVSAASLAALPTVTAFRTYIESSGSFGQSRSIQTGVTISNPSSTRITVQISANNSDGTPTGFATSLSIPPGGQFAKLANELFPQLPSTFRGMLRITAPSPVSVVAMRGRYNERGDLLMAPTPTYDESSAPLAITEFPQFVSGAGYTTQLMLLSTGLAQTGSLWVFSNDGSMMPSNVLQPVP